jgi:RimJ/RimL family protein N-acetyltransferase
MSNKSWVEPIKLEGDHVRLEPISVSHASGLAEIADDGLFRFFAGLRPSGRDIHAGEQFICSVLAQTSSVSYTVIDRSSGKVVGSTSYINIRDDSRGLEIGSTRIAESYQGTVVNPEAKLLLLTHAFETLGAIRVQFRTDSRNLQSQRAIEKLGAIREGVFRHDTITPDGYLRDSVFYSILSEEWPVIKAKLCTRLSLF